MTFIAGKGAETAAKENACEQSAQNKP